MKFGALLLAVFLATHPLSAAVYSYTVSPDQIGAGQLLNAPDPLPATVPVGAGIGAPDWGESSFFSDLDGTTTKYTNLYVDLQLAFQTSTPLTVGDLAGITYYTKKGDALVGLDWAIRLYTKKAVGQPSGWYQTRLEALNPNADNTDWNLADANTEGWFVRATSGNGGGTTNINLSLTGLQADYGSQEILYFAFLVGSSGNTEIIRNNLDGIVVTLANGDEARINLVPEPSVALLLLGAAGVFYGIRRLRRTSFPASAKS